MPEDLTLNYARAYGRRAGFGRRPALVLIDFAMAYYDPGCPLYAGEGAETALASALRLREAAHRTGVPVVLTRVTYSPGGVEGGRFWDKAAPLSCFVAGEATAGWAPGLEPREGEIVVSKHYPSAFFGTALAPMLTRLGIDNAILTGLTTSGCVRASCVDAMSHGFLATVVGDACGDRHPDPHRANLFDMDAKYADVVGEAEMLEHLATLAPRRAGAMG
ncbi:isochorismatase family protein [Rubellimicrobium aerolatum]|uniref:Isochorismatase family protein n=1 Tax=Rubellimicrobium aerolatum TaxID=490979 RepID=A0ABW0SC79_9RHOB|nr:isochorismatase family protein [Rubellimicrobium aerolatum]MBP1806286.1 maleamate amidohydrolase [Rubellimicrobium aerolatum]